MSRVRLERLLREAPRVSPFLVLGDPTPELSVELARASIACGADMIEIGFPYSDPVADGPAIQRADMRALENGTSTSKAMTILARIRGACPDAPLNLLVYANLVHARGLDRFCRDAAAAGASSLLVPDVCLEESASLKRACRAAGLAHVQLVGPLTSRERLKQIDTATTGFVYLVAHQGVTGVREGSFGDVEALIARTAETLVNPLCVGFGLSTPEHIERVFASGARLAVVGSHLANVIEAGVREDDVVGAFSRALEPLVAAMPVTK